MRERATRRWNRWIAGAAMLALGSAGAGAAGGCFGGSSSGGAPGPGGPAPRQIAAGGDYGEAETTSAAPSADMAAPTSAHGGAGAPPPAAEPRPAGPDYQRGEQYARLQENDFIAAAQDAMSTFSLDVDTASYTIMRRDLGAGRLPRPDSVRVEEYVNFFDYGDSPPDPQAEAPFAVHLESAPSRFGPGHNLLRVGVQGMEIPASQRPAANIVFLVDVSGSMQQHGKLDLVKYGLTTLVDSLRPDDTIGIVVYAGREAVALPPTSVKHRGAILETIAQLRAGGSTNGEGGIRAAYDLAAQHFRPDGINRVVLCTDGDFNVGLTGDPLVDLIEEYRERDITLSVLGFGRGNINDRDMERLADHGNGNYAYIDGRNEALRVLQEDLQGTLQVIAKDVKVQVRFNPAVVERFRLVGYENRVLAHEDFDDDTVDAAEIGSGDFTTAFMEYALKDGVDPRQDRRRLATVRLRYKAPNGDQSRLLERTVKVSDVRPSFGEASAVFRFGAAVAEFAEILRNSKHAEQSSLREVARVASEATWSQSEDTQQFVRLVRKAAELKR